MALTSSEAQINVTPLIDVLLVLLIIFMVIQPSVPHGLQAAAPEAGQRPHRQRDDRSTPVVLVVRSAPSGHGLVWSLDATPVTEASIEPALQEISRRHGQETIFVRGEPGLEFAPVARAIGYARQAGIVSVGILTSRDDRAGEPERR